MSLDEQEFGEMRAEVRGLSRAFEDFRAESRRQHGEVLVQVTKRLDNHAQRLGRLERWRTGIIFAFGAVVAMASGFVKLLGVWIGLTGGK